MNESAGLVFVVDDDASMRKALELLLRLEQLEVREFASAHEFLSADRPDVPSCAILDVRMPGASGLDLQEQLRQAGIDTPLIFLTGHADVRTSVRAMKAGASEFLTKPVDDEELMRAVHHALAVSRESRARRAALASLSRRFGTLTPREREVLQFVVSGLLNKQIAGELGLSLATVKLHRAHVMQKMQAGSVAELVNMTQLLEAGRG